METEFTGGSKMSDFNSQQELMFYLSSDENNRVINKTLDQIFKFHSGRVYVYPCESKGNQPSYENLINFEAYSKYTKPCWKEAINEKPIFAFFEYIEEKNNWSKLPVLIISYDANRNYPFAAYPTMTYKNIKPATKEEIQVYINNIPEV